LQMKSTALLGYVCGIFLISFTITLPSAAQNLQTLVSFEASDGSLPSTALAQGVDGNLYGATWGNNGTIFKVSPSGEFSSLYSFCTKSGCPDGSFPQGLTLAPDGNFYGVTQSGGANSQGTLFRITPAGVLTTLYAFCSQPNCTDGAQPVRALSESIDGYLYGTTTLGGVSGEGTIFKVTLTGKLTTIYSFCAKAGCADGAEPYGALIRASDGSFYGVTALGGNTEDPICIYGCGVVYKLTGKSEIKTLYRFCSKLQCVDGAVPSDRLIEAANGNFYGTTDVGGAGGQGTAYEITPSGQLTILHSFCHGSCSDGFVPYAGLIQGTDGNFYGTASQGGTGLYGTAYSITGNGTFSTLFSFDNTDGAVPVAALTQATDGTFYGSTQQGGESGLGTLFSLSNGLGPFVQSVPTLGKRGLTVIILGTNLTGSTSVEFNGVTAKFTIVSESEITTEVPKGATTGKIVVQTPNGTLVSNTEFLVTD
jgi:uncharacterized repeat protein (TIGR03803 family)